MVVLGVDPGFTVTGFGVIRYEKGKAALIDYGDLSMSSKKPLQERLVIFHDFMEEKIKLHGVTNLALETPFLGKNAQNFLKLGYLRGVLLLLTSRHNLILHEFSPREVKRAITGFGGADKEQLARVVVRLFPRMTMPKKLDVTDAVAVTLCGLWQGKSYIQKIKR